MIPHRELPSGLFAGRYELGQVLGRGGFATVVRAHDINLRRDVALKIATGYGRDVDERRWSRELAAMMRLGELGLGLVPLVFDVGCHEGLDYFTMALFRGGSLDQRIAARGPVPIAEVVRMVDNFADLDRVHDVGQLHRDIKPANVLFVEASPVFGSCVLGDWGIAEHVSDEPLTSECEPIGTRRYMSPQRQSGQRATPLDDQYAAARTIEDALRGYADDDISLPERLARVIDRATHPEPEARYESMSALAVAFSATAAPLLGTRRSMGTAATRVRHTASESLGGMRDRIAALEDQLKQSREEALERRRERDKVQRTLADVKRTQEGTARELSGVRRSLAMMEAAMARMAGVAQQNADEVRGAAAASGGGGRVRSLFSAAPRVAGGPAVAGASAPASSGGGGPVADFAEFARRRRGQGVPHLSDASAPARSAAQRAQQAASAARAAGERAAPYAYRYGTRLMALAVVCGLAALWAVLSARLPGTVVGAVQVHPSWAGSLTWAAVDALMFAAACRTVSGVLARRPDTAAVALGSGLGVAALVVGYGAHQQGTSPWMLAPGQWYLVGMCLLTLGLLISSHVPAALQAVSLTIVLAAAIPAGSLVVALWVMAGAVGVAAPIRLATHHRTAQQVLMSAD